MGKRAADRVRCSQCSGRFDEMKTIDVVLEADSITDWVTFHESSQAIFGFPDFYGSNLDAWIDCLSYLDNDDRMSRFHLSRGEILNITLLNSASLKQRAPEIFDAFVECVTVVNQRYFDRNSPVRITLTFL